MTTPQTPVQKDELMSDARLKIIKARHVEERLCAGANQAIRELVAEVERLKSLEEENRILREALFPRPEIKDCSPLILYFDTKEDRDEFIAAVAEAKPNMRSYKI